MVKTEIGNVALFAGFDFSKAAHGAGGYYPLALRYADFFYARDRKKPRLIAQEQQIISGNMLFAVVISS
jgi:hypothetical protein